MQPSKRILIAEDDEVSRLSLSELLKQLGYDVSAVEDGHAATRFLRENECDLVIADIRMAGNEHLELVDTCNSDAGQLPVILVTGFPATETAVRALELQVVAYLIKPVNFDELVGHVERALTRRQIVEETRRLSAQLSHWRTNVEVVGENLKADHGGSMIDPLETYFHLTFDNVHLALQSLEQSISSLVRSTQRDRQSLQIAGRAPLLVIEALRETITVLEKTKDSFRSKELAELRRRLEKLLHMERNSSDGSQAPQK